MTAKRKYEKPVLRTHGSINRFICGLSPTATDFDSVTQVGMSGNAVCLGMGGTPAGGLRCNP